MGTINVLIAVDGTALASQVVDGALSPGSPDAPTKLDSYSASGVYISMIAAGNSVSNGDQGQSELEISANPGDTVEWVITTLDNNISQTAYLYGSSFNPAPVISSPSTYFCGEAASFLGTGNPPASTPTKFTNRVSNVSATVQETGETIQQSLSFVLVNNANGQVIGYFQWSPFITVN
jgi:hypothetical protein